MDLPRRLNPDTLLWCGYSGMFFFLPVATSPMVICGAFVIGVWIVSGTFLKDMKIWITSDMKIPVLILMVLPWIGLIYTPVRPEGLNVALKTHYWIFTIALMPVLRLRVRAEEQGERGHPDVILRIFLAGLLLNSVLSTLQVLDVIPLRRGLPVGLMGGDSAHIPFSLLLISGILVSSFYFFKARSWKVRAAYAVIMLQFFVTMSFVGARSGYLALIVMSPLLVYNLVGRRHFLRILAGSIILICLLFASPVVQSRVAKIKDDLSHYAQGDVNTSIGLRFHMWEIAWAEIKKSPFIGTGTAGFVWSWEHYKNKASLPFFIHGNPHNSFLYMTVSFGLPGLAAFCWLLFIMARNGWHRRNSPLGFGVLSFTIVFITGSLVDTPLLSIAAAHAFSLFAGIAGALDAS